MPVWIVLFAFVFAGAPSDTENVKLVTTGEVRKIDTKSKTFQFKFRLDQPISRPQAYPSVGGRRGYGRRGYPPAGPVDDSMEVKVFVSEGTRLGFNDSLHFADFKVGDRVTVTGFRKGRGDDLEALAVVRN